MERRKVLMKGYYETNINKIEYRGIQYEGRIDTCEKRKKLKKRVKKVTNPQNYREDLQEIENMIYEAKEKKGVSEIYIFPCLCGWLYSVYFAILIGMGQPENILMRVGVLIGALIFSGVVVKRGKDIYRFECEQIMFYETIKDIIIELHKNERKHKKKKEKNLMQ